MAGGFGVWCGGGARLCRAGWPVSPVPWHPAWAPLSPMPWHLGPSEPHIPGSPGARQAQLCPECGWSALVKHKAPSHGVGRR